jgi:hypothetical protein
MIRMLNVDPDLVHACDTSNFERILGELAKTPEQARQIQGTFALTFKEFEHFNGPVFLHPEVRAFLRKIHQVTPHVWYFLSAEPGIGNMLMFLAVHSDPEGMSVTNDNVVVNPSFELLILLRERLISTAKFADKMADDTTYILSKITSNLPEPINDLLLAEILRSRLEES